MLQTFRKRYDLVLLDISKINREGEEVKGVQIVDLRDPDLDNYRYYFQGIDAVVHCAYQGKQGVRASFEDELVNIKMTRNIYQICCEEDVRRLVVCSSNQATHYYERLIWSNKWDVVNPDMRPLADHFYGWGKEAIEHLGFVYATGHVNGKKLQNVQLRIGAPRETDLYKVDPRNSRRIHRGLGAYLSVRDQVQLFIKSIETENIEDENGIPFQIFYGVSDNSHRFWSIVNARKIIGYEPEDNSQIKFAKRISELMKEVSVGKSFQFNRIRFDGFRMLLRRLAKTLQISR
jgi:nucleoside-diphosphate-sugar epimerase